MMDIDPLFWEKKDPNPGNLPIHEISEFPENYHQDDNVNGHLVFDKDGNVIGAGLAFSVIDESVGVIIPKSDYKRYMYITIPDRRLVGVISETPDPDEDPTDFWHRHKRKIEDFLRLNFGEGSYESPGILVTAGGFLSGPYQQHEELREVYTWEDIANKTIIEHVPIEHLPYRSYMIREQEKEMEELRSWLRD